MINHKRNNNINYIMIKHIMAGSALGSGAATCALAPLICMYVCIYIYIYIYVSSLHL